MFPSVSIKDESIKDKLKQRKWDQRFSSGNGIPQYSPIKDKHTKSYRKVLNSSNQKQKYESTPSKNKQSKTYFQKKVQLFDKLKSQHPVYITHLQQFQDFLTSSKTPNFYTYYTALPLLKQVDVNGYILKVKKGIKQQNSPYQRISTAINARQQCLSSIKTAISKLKGQFFKSEADIMSIKDLIKHYRTLTANAIDEIKRWRDSLNLAEQRAIYYSDQNQNYLIKILNDNQFMFNSELSNYINFGQKNDPFIIIPLKKAEGKQSNQFLSILQTQKNIAYYQKYMQYLASQKAYELSLVTAPTPIKKQSRYPQIQKIYKSKSNAKFQINKNQTQIIQYDNDEAQKQKLRQQRLKKNQQRINAIKNVYQSYTNKIKLRQKKKQKQAMEKPQTDVEQKQNAITKEKRKQDNKRKKSVVSDQEFDKLVKNKVQRQKNKKLLFHQAPLIVRQTKSLTKLPKAEDKIIDNLKQIQSTLKNKLSFIHQQTKKQQSTLKKMGLSGEKFHKKTNQALISQLKNQIIKNLQQQNKQRQQQRSKRRKQQQKAIQQIKAKMKRQMQQKLETKKRQKLLQRQQLQKKLKQQQQRLNKQRQLQLQLQLKLAKQKQLRQLEKIKRQSLQRQKKFKQELQKQQKLRREREDAVLKQRSQKEKILEQLKKRQLKEQLEQQIKDQMKNKYGENPKLYDKEQMGILRSQKQQQLSKQIQLLKLKQNQQIQQIRRQNQLRQRMLKLKKQQQELKRKQVQHLMKSVIQQEKQEIHRETLKKRIQLQEQIKNSAKQKLLEQYRSEREAILEKTKMEKQKQLQEDVYRQKIKQKIQKQLRMQAIQRTKKQMEQRQTRRYEMNIKMDNSKVKFNEALQKDINKQQIQNQVKKEMIERVIFDKQAQRQSAKNDLRAQFERQLMASAVPDIYKQNQADPIMKKNIDSFKEDGYLRSKMNELQSIRPTNQKAFQNLEQDFLRQSPKKQTSKNVSIRNSGPTQQQLYIYSKKKQKVSQMREQPSYKLPKKLQSEEEQGFQLMPVQQQMQQEPFEVKIIKKSSLNKNNSKKEPKQFQKKKSYRKQQQDVDSEDTDQIQKKSKNTKGRNSNKKKYQSEDFDSQDQIEHNRNQKKISPKKKRSSDQAISSQQQLTEIKRRQSQLKRTQNSKLSKSPLKRSTPSQIDRMSRNQSQVQRNVSRKQSQMQRNRSRKDNQLQRNRSKKQTQLQKNLIRKQSQIQRNISRKQQAQQSPVKIYYDAQFPKMADQFPDQSKVQIRQTKHAVQSKFQMKLQAIPQSQLDYYLANHFEQLPQVQRAIQMLGRQQLYRKLINELTFCMLLGYQKNILVGIALAFHDRNKTDMRKFQIVHIATYNHQDLRDFLISTVNYIFKKDPVDQIEFHYKFDQANQDQLSYSLNFNKWFDKLGNVYQKKVDDNIFQRKYVFKRQFNQKCQVILGGINKNTFRNIFTVYSSVLMSDSDMLQYKEQLRNVVTPQNQISYAIMIAELFRTYLTPDQAQSLKLKVKQFAKLKQLLILVVMLQKKKVKMDELKLSQYKNLIQLNMKLMSQGKDVIRYCKDGGMDLNRIYYAQLNQAFNLPFNFQTTSLPIQSQQTKRIHQISYFRLSPLPPNKLHIIKSSLYNSQLHILPTQSSKYKLFVINAQQYNQIKQVNHLDIFMYVRLFLKNVKSHNTASWKYVWLPEMTDKANYNIREFKSFLNKDIYCHDSINISYKQFLPNALIIEPEHRDLVITPPFIVGIMSMSLEQVTEGSPLYARMIDVPALRTIQIQE